MRMLEPLRERVRIVIGPTLAAVADALPQADALLVWSAGRDLVREVFTYLRDQLGEDPASANLVISGDRTVLTRDGEEMIDLVRKGVLRADERVLFLHTGGAPSLSAYEAVLLGREPAAA
jgi:hypothetical protein